MIAAHGTEGQVQGLERFAQLFLDRVGQRLYTRVAPSRHRPGETPPQQLHRQYQHHLHAGQLRRRIGQVGLRDRGLPGLPTPGGPVNTGISQAFW
ncbi:hypothetical protein D9M71_643070 [compost metagenome]